GPQEVRLRPGSYRLLATKDGKPIKNEIVSIARGKKQVVTVTLERAAQTQATLSFTPPPPGPLDHLDPANIPAHERFPWQPKELVAVLGEHRGRQWSSLIGVAFSANGKLVASCGGDNHIYVWDATTLRLIQMLEGHSDFVWRVTFSRDGHRLVSASAD